MTEPATRPWRLRLAVGVVAALVGGIALMVVMRGHGPSDEALAAELTSMAAADQAAGDAQIALGLPSAGQPLSSEQRAALDHVEAVDRSNTARLKVIVDQHGWPGRRLVGDGAAHDAWLLVQHADADLPFQKRVLALMEAAGDDVRRDDVAFLSDRIAAAEGRPQRYGTQFTCRGGRREPVTPLEEPDRIDEIRRASGLSSVAENLARLDRLYGPCSP